MGARSDGRLSQDRLQRPCGTDFRRGPAGDCAAAPRARGTACRPPADAATLGRPQRDAI